MKKNKNNLERMIQLAEDVFSSRTDSEQLDVDQEVIERLKQIHPDSVSEFDDGAGPVAWVLMIPTTLDLMNAFLEKKITEKDLFDRTPIGISYEAIYLCSALVLEEYRQQGISKKLSLKSIENISTSNSIKALFVWEFSEEGAISAKSIANACGQPLYRLLK